ncbi:hypothetical protein AX16_000484 [Volvariella volvacea WC 439]|nr:hypothetical protein AX16_000484 [Volvariella volvacea WC 439]
MADADAERAAKAARAKAMLKKRQQQKGVQQKDTGSTQPSLPPSRTTTPIPSKATPAAKSAAEEKQSDLSEVFSTTKDNPDWLNSLPRAPSPPPTATQARFIAPTPTKATNGAAGRPPIPSSVSAPLFDSPKSSPVSNYASGDQVASLQSENSSLKDQLKQLQPLKQRLEELEAQIESGKTEYRSLEEESQNRLSEIGSLLQNERKTVSLLVSEKASIIAELQRLEGVEQRAQVAGDSLKNEQLRVAELETRVHELESEARSASQRAQLSETRERELSERCRDQERQLQLTNASVKELREESEKHQRKVRELEEQILGDDRVEKLETSLRNTQDRADELEFRLSEKAEAYAALKAERDSLYLEGQTHAANEEEWKARHSDLESRCSDLLEQLSSTTAEKGTLEEDKAKLQLELNSVRKNTEELQEKIVKVTSDLASANRQVQALQQELRSANRRADDAEKTKQDLQTEGTQLMRSLEEMRPKIVELTGAKAELVEKVDNLQHTLRTRDTRISQLEGTVGELEANREDAVKDLQKRLDVQTKEAAAAKEEITVLQSTVEELKEEIESALASVRTLEAERSNYHQETGRRLEEIERLSGATHEQALELKSLREQLEAREHERVEEEAFLDRAQSEIENLRATIASKDEEIDGLRETIASKSSNQNEAARQSLDSEIISSLRQQHALDMSNAHSTIRALENDVFDAQAKYHTLVKHVGSLEDQLAQAKLALTRAGISRSFSPAGTPSRPSSRGSPTEGRRSSLGRGSSNLSSVPPISRVVLEQNLTPETLHKRKVSLSMLKARMESEAKAAASSHSHPPSRAVTPAPPHLSSPLQQHKHLHQHGTPLTSVEEVPSTSRVYHLDQSLHRPQFMDESHVFWCHACRGDLVIL